MRNSKDKKDVKKLKRALILWNGGWNAQKMVWANNSVTCKGQKEKYDLGIKQDI